MNDLNVKTKNSLQKAFILSLSSLFLPVFKGGKTKRVNMWSV